MLECVRPMVGAAARPRPEHRCQIEMSHTRGLNTLSVGLAVAALALLASAARAATLSVTVLQHDGKPLAGAVVTVRSLDGAAKPSPPVRAVMDQVNQMFAPDLLVIPV